MAEYIDCQKRYTQLSAKLESYIGTLKKWLTSGRKCCVGTKCNITSYAGPPNKSLIQGLNKNSLYNIIIIQNSKIKVLVIVFTMKFNQRAQYIINYRILRLNAWGVY